MMPFHTSLSRYIVFPPADSSKKIASLGSIGTPPLVAARIEFWPIARAAWRLSRLMALRMNGSLRHGCCGTRSSNDEPRDALLLVERLKRRTRDSDVLTLCDYVHGTDVHGRTIRAFRRPGDGPLGHVGRFGE
jgi:hypothetical protein